MNDKNFTNYAKLENQFKGFYENYCFNDIHENDIKRLLLCSAKLASKYGCVNNLKFIIGLDNTIVEDEVFSVFRVCAEIQNFNNYKATVDFLDTVKNFNSLSNEAKDLFLKLALGKNLLRNINYLIQGKKVNFKISDELCKIIIRTKNTDVLDFFIHNTNLAINKDVVDWSLENGYQNELLQIIVKENLEQSVISDILDNVYKIFKEDKNNNFISNVLLIKALQNYPDYAIQFKRFELEGLNNILLNQKLKDNLKSKNGSVKNKI